MNKLLKDVYQGIGDGEKQKRYIKYIQDLLNIKKWDGRTKKEVLVNFALTKKPYSFFCKNYELVDRHGDEFDGIHITLNTKGATYDYVAMKNTMLRVYPESIIDIQLVSTGDETSFFKKNGTVEYTHNILNPFSTKDSDIIGGYCVIKNKRGEFLTLLSKLDIDKAKNIASTKNIWNQWYKEMALKTIMKKAVKVFFDDIFDDINEVDNKNYDLSKNPTLQEVDLSEFNKKDGKTNNTKEVQKQE